MAELAPTEEEIEAVAEMVSSLDDETKEALQAAFEQSGTAEEFANLIMIGECPRCGSAEVGDCDNDPVIDDICVGRCYQCGLLWCTECEEVLTEGQTSCGHWKVCDECGKAEAEDCQLPASDCPAVIDWKEANGT